MMQFEKSRIAYAIEVRTRLACREGSAERWASRLEIEIAVQTQVGGWSSGVAAVKKGRMERIKSVRGTFQISK